MRWKLHVRFGGSETRWPCLVSRPNLLTTIIIPIALLSNWNSITMNSKSYLILILLLETLLLAVFLVLDILLFYIFFESILPPLFILIGLFGSGNKVRASYYIFLYTLGSSLFLLLSIVTMSSIMGTTDFDALFKTYFAYTKQLFIFVGVFIAIAVKTPTIFLNNWLLRAHVESPLGGSIVLAAIVLKLSLYGIFRLILPILPLASLNYTYIVYLIGVITITYASFSTLRTTDVKELIAYSSVSHAAVYLIAVFSNVFQGIEGSILLGLGHGFVSSALFLSVGGVLYDRSGTRDIGYYRGMAQLMPIFAVLFFIFSLANCGTPLTLNFVGEFLCLYATFERSPFLGSFAASSIVFSAAYTILLFNRIFLGGSFTLFLDGILDLTKRELNILLVLALFTVILGVYPSFILDGLHYNVSSLIYSVDLSDNIYMLGLIPCFVISTSNKSTKFNLNPSYRGDRPFSSTSSRKLDPVSGVVGCYFTTHSLPTLGVIWVLIGLPIVTASTLLIASMHNAFYVQNIAEGPIPLIDFHFHLSQHLLHFWSLDRPLDFSFNIIENMIIISQGFYNRGIDLSFLIQGYNQLYNVLVSLDQLLYNMDTVLRNVEELINNNPQHNVPEEFLRQLRSAQSVLREYQRVFRFLISGFREAEVGLLLRGIIEDTSAPFLTEGN
uniref:NADH-ubiquinone oxidoreductase chain 4 n=1 Tax=Ophiognomonia clavigignenti-juglandacearum TaxID=218668 RepID=A0A2C9DSC9_9PEZI|nr:NADH dehydrogenase subunit 4 [Ophiognomonia clavigignenti-juglandacearum]